MQDIMDGFFPSELQNRYPDGVPIEVKHAVHYMCFPVPSVYFETTAVSLCKKLKAINY